jgi:WD40 repeat protein
MNTISFYQQQQEMNKVDQTELEKKYNLLQEEYLKVKKSNEKNLIDIKSHLETIMDLNNKIDIQKKKIVGYQSENIALKTQNRALEKTNKELSEINKQNEEYIFNYKKHSQKLQIDYGKLLDVSGKMHMEIDKLRSQLLELQEHSINKISNFTEKKEEIKEGKNKNNNLIINPEEIKVPNKIKYKKKIHYKGITSINFNEKGTSFITSGEDNVINIFNNNNKETGSFKGFNDIITGACFDNKEQFIFAGSLDNTAKLWNLKTKKLISDYTGHKAPINCVKSFKNKEVGITGSLDCHIKEWDFNKNSLTRDLNCQSGCYSLEIPSDDSYVLSGHDDGIIRMWDNNEESPKEFKLHNDKVLDIKTIDKNLFLSLGEDNNIKLFDIRKGEPIYTIDDNIIKDFSRSTISVSSNKKYFVVGINNGIIYIMNLKEGTINSNIDNNKGIGTIKAIYWKPYRSEIYIGDSDGNLTIWGTN